MSSVLLWEALQHVPDNAIVVEIAPHCVLQTVLRRALPSTCSIVVLMDKRQSDNLVHLLTALGKYVHFAIIFMLTLSAEKTTDVR